MIPNATCRICKSVFPVPMLAGSGLATGNIAGCPYCGGPAPVEDMIDGQPISRPKFIEAPSPAWPPGQIPHFGAFGSRRPLVEGREFRVGVASGNDLRSLTFKVW